MYTTYDLKLIMRVRFYARQVDLSLSARMLRDQTYQESRTEYLEEKRKRLAKKNSVKTLPRSSDTAATAQ